MKKAKILVALSLALSLTCIGGMTPAFAKEKDFESLDLEEVLDNFKELDEDSFFTDLDEEDGKVFVSGLLSDSDIFSDEDSIFDFLKENQSLFDCNDLYDNLKIEKAEEDELGFTHVVLDQCIDDIPVENKSVVLHFNDEGQVINVTADVEKDITELSKLGDKNVTTAQAVSIAKSQFDYDELAYEPPVETVAYVKDGQAYQTYKINIKFYKPEITNYNVYVEATSGKVIDKEDLIRYNGAVNGTGVALDGTTKQINMYQKNGHYEFKDVTRNTKPDAGDSRYNPWNPWGDWGRWIVEDEDSEYPSFASQNYGYGYGDDYDDNTSNVDNSIITYSANNREVQPGNIVTSYTNQVTDKDKESAVSAHYYADVVYDFYNNLFGRKSLDNRGMNLISTVHYGRNYNNAFWDGSQMVYGDGDGKTFTEFSGDLDVVAHEMTHGLTSNTANLNYKDQSGALNESMSDVMGVLVKTYDQYDVKNGGEWEFNPSDWVVGSKIYTPDIDGDALRSLANPTLYQQPDNMSEYYYTKEDNGGVHTNSGIPNKAAYLVAQKIGCEKTARIYYRALTTYMTRTTDFRGARNALMQAANDLYGANSREASVVVNAFSAVGVN